MIGNHIIVTASPNASLRGVCGIVIDETKHILVVKTACGEKILLKRAVTYDTQGTKT